LSYIDDSINILKQFCKPQSPEYEDTLKKYCGILVESRFTRHLKDEKEINYILEHINFSVDDLLIIYEHIVPKFDLEINIFKHFEKCYKVRTQEKILPFIKDYSFLKKNPGVLIYLINWLNSYEKLLTKVGFEMSDYQELR